MNNYLTPAALFGIELESLKNFKEFCEKYQTELSDGFELVNKSRCKSFIEFCCMVFGKKLQSTLFTKMFKNNSITSYIESIIDYYDSNDNSGYYK